MLVPSDFRGVTQIEATGRFLQYLECTSATRADVVLWVDGQPVGTMLPGMCYELDEQCRRWELYPVAPGCTGRVVIGDGRMMTGRVSNTVGTEGQSLAEALSGQSFIASNTRTAGAGVFPTVVLQANARMVLRQVRFNWVGVLRIFVASGTMSAPLGSVSLRSAASPFGILAAGSALNVDDATGITTMPAGLTSYVGATSLIAYLSGGSDVSVLPVPLVLAPNDCLVMIGGTAAGTVLATVYGNLL